MKNDKGKVLLHLLPADVLKSVGEVLTYGASKYGHDNFYNDINKLKYSRYLNAAKRHMLAWEQGEDEDKESGLHHIDHCIASLMFLRLQTIYSLPSVDDRLCHLVGNPQKNTGKSNKVKKSTTHLQDAKDAKDDEFYTQISDIEVEMPYYKTHFKDKIIYCNCDKPESNFVKYFVDNFHDLGLKELIFTHYNKPNSVVTHYDGTTFTNKPLIGDGDFRSDECVNLLQLADIVITNPPFSLFREYITLLRKYNKKFLIIGNLLSIKYKNIANSIQSKTMRLGVNRLKKFIRPDGTLRKVQARWYTNLEHGVEQPKLILTEKYDAERYPKYAHYDAINVDKALEMPMDYDGLMGVPISFLDKFNPDQFELVTFLSQERYTLDNIYLIEKGVRTDKAKRALDGLHIVYDGHLEDGLYNKETGEQYKRVFERIIIKRKDTCQL